MNPGLSRFPEIRQLRGASGKFLISCHFRQLPVIATHRISGTGHAEILLPGHFWTFHDISAHRIPGAGHAEIFAPRSFPAISAHIIPFTGLEDAEQNTDCMLIGITVYQAIWGTERIPSLQTSQNISSIYNGNGRLAYPQQATVSKQPAAGTCGPVAQRSSVTYMRFGTTSIDELKDDSC